MATTKQAVSFTLRQDIVKWLQSYARTLGSNKSQLVEKALESYKKNEIKKQLKASFQRMKNDEEMKSLAEMGLEDFLVQLDETDTTR